MTEPAHPKLLMSELLHSELAPGEEIVWCQRPRPVDFARRVIGQSVFSLVFVAFIVVAVAGDGLAGSGRRATEGIRSRSNDSTGVSLIAVVVVGVGIGLVVFPAWEFFKAMRTIYAITNRRAILIEASWRPTIYSLVGDKLIDIHRVERKRGRGDIVFHRQTVKRARRGDCYYDLGFLDVKNVTQVEAMLRDLHARTASPASHSVG